MQFCTKTQIVYSFVAYFPLHYGDNQCSADNFRGLDVPREALLLTQPFSHFFVVLRKSTYSMEPHAVKSTKNQRMYVMCLVHAESMIQEAG